jgi:hypothetical protein
MGEFDQADVSLSESLVFGARRGPTIYDKWDILASIDASARIRPELCGIALGNQRKLLPWLCSPNKSIAATCQFELDGQPLTIRIRDGKLEELLGSVQTDASIRTDTSTFLLLTTRRLRPSDCADRISVAGSRDRAEQVLGATWVTF